MARLTSFSDSEPAEPRPDYALEVRSLERSPLSFWMVGVFREDVLVGKIEFRVGAPRVEIIDESGSTGHTMRLRPYYPSLMASRPFRSVPMMEISAELGSKPLAAYWLHDHSLPVRPDRARHQFRLLPQDYSPTRAHDMDGNLLVRARPAWRDSDLERGVRLGIELVEERDPLETLLAALGLALLSREIVMYSKFGV